MAFEGGRIPVLGLSGQQLAQQLTGSAVQSLPAGYQPYAGLAAGGASALLNVGLSAAVGTQAAAQLGFDLNVGQTFLQSQVTPFLSSTVSNLVSSQISQSLNNLGPVGSTLGTLGGQLASSAATSLVNGIFGTDIGGGLGDLFGGSGDSTATGGASRAFPGAGAEPAASYGGSVYNLGPSGPDVVFSIQPASGTTPQESGLSQLTSGNSTGVSVASSTLTNASELQNAAVNAAKTQIMTNTGTPVAVPDNVA